MNLLVLIIIIIILVILIRYNNTPINKNTINKNTINKNIIENKLIQDDKVKKIYKYLKPDINVNPNEYLYDLKTDVNLYSYADIFEFIINTQSFYLDNEQSYEQFIYELKRFMKIYEIVLIDPSYSNDYLTVMKDKKISILNHFNSIKIKSILNENKINIAMDDLEKIIDKYYNKILIKNKEYINETGYTYKTKIIDNSNIDGYNSYNKYNSTFEIY
jgi:hypothetical protein